VKTVASLAALPAVLIFTALSTLSQPIPVQENFARLTAQEDTDGDKRITIHDRLTPFELRDRNGATVLVVSDVYRLSVLMQELDWAVTQNRSEVTVADLKLDETVVDRTRRMIREVYWNALTRRIDATHLDQVLGEKKSHPGRTSFTCRNRMKRRCAISRNLGARRLRAGGSLP
jgi:hypothetical protein